MAWLVSVAILLTYCIVIPSVDIVAATMAYVFCSAVITFDNKKHYKELENLLRQLHEVTMDNERLEKEAQAVELRAMIGNVAHDLKTVINSNF